MAAYRVQAEKQTTFAEEKKRINTKNNSERKLRQIKKERKAELGILALQFREGELLPSRIWE